MYVCIINFTSIHFIFYIKYLKTMYIYTIMYNIYYLKAVKNKD